MSDVWDRVPGHGHRPGPRTCLGTWSRGVSRDPVPGTLGAGTPSVDAEGGSRGAAESAVWFIPSHLLPQRDFGAWLLDDRAAPFLSLGHLKRAVASAKQGCGPASFKIRLSSSSKGGFGVFGAGFRAENNPIRSGPP